MSVLKVYNGTAWESVGAIVGAPGWTDYTPSNTNITVGNGTQTARYCQFGTTVFVRYSLTWGSTTSYGGVIQVGMPVAAKASTTYVGSVYMLDNTTQHYSGCAVVGLVSASTASIQNSAASGSGDVTGTTPFTWTTNDKLVVTVAYEAATSSLVLTGSSVPSADTPPTSPSAYDQEFDATSSSLPSGWSWVNQSTSTYAERNGWGALDLAAGGADESRAIVRGINTGSSWTLTAKLQSFSIGATGTSPSRHVVLRDSATSKEMRFAILSDGTAVVDYYTDASTFSARRGAAVTLLPNPQVFNALQYIKITKNSASSWDWWVSTDGAGWMPMHTTINVSTDLTPDQFGVGGNMRARRTMVDVAWFRVT